MTLRNLLAGVALILLTVPAYAADQRALSRVPPADGGGDEGRRAQPRESEVRRAEPRPQEAPVPAPAAAAPAKTSNQSSSSHATEVATGGPVVVTPTVVAPAVVGGVSVGRAFSVGSAFSVGHDTFVDTASSDDSRRHNRRDHADHVVDTVIVPVTVPVYMPVYVPVAASSVAASPSDGELADESILPLPVEPSAPTRRTRGYLTFTPWYNVGAGLEAGYPVPLPTPDMFAEGNVSSTVADTRRDTNGTSDTISVLGYAKDVGGIAFTVQPADASVYIDGRFVGSVSDYTPEHEPLLLRFGVYTVELRAKGYVTERFPAYVTLGDVVPFSGTLTKSGDAR